MRPTTAVVLAALATVAACDGGSEAVDGLTTPSTSSTDETPSTTTSDTTTEDTTEPTRTFRVSGTLTLPDAADLPEGELMMAWYDPQVLDVIYTVVALGEPTAGAHTWAVDQPARLPDDAYRTDPYSGALMAMIAPAFFVDTDGDGLPTASDVMVAGPPLALMHYPGGEGAPFEGWMQLEMDRDTWAADVRPFQGDLAGIDLDANLLMEPPADALVATLLDTLELDGPARLDLVALLDLQGDTLGEEPLVSVALDGDAADVVLPDVMVPLPQHRIVDPANMPDVEAALYLAVVYEDLNDNGRWDAGDAWLGSSADLPAVDQRTITWSRPTGLLAGWVAPWLGGVGWNLTSFAGADRGTPPPVVGWSEGVLIGPASD